MQLQHLPVAGGRGVEGDAATRLLALLLVRSDELRDGHRTRSGRTPSALGPTVERRPHDLAHEGLGLQRVDQDSVGDLPRDLEHPLANRRQPDRRRPVALWTGPERRRHQRVGRELAAEVEWPARVPCRPDRPQAEHVLAHPRGRPRPRRAEPALDVRTDLGAEAEHEPAAGQTLEVPARVGGLHHAPRERDRDPGAEADARRRPRRERQRQERVVVGLGREHAVDAQRLGARGPRRRLGKRHAADRHVDLRTETIPARSSVCGVDHRRRIGPCGGVR